METVATTYTLVNERALIAPGFLSPEEALSLLQELEGPIGAMARGETTVLLGPLQNLPLPKTAFQFRKVLQHGQAATLVRLDNVQQLLHKAWLQHTNPRYDWEKFLSQYEEATRRDLALVWGEALRTHPHPGYYAQLKTDPRVQAGQVGLNPTDLYRMLKTHLPELLLRHGILHPGDLRKLSECPLLIHLRYPVADCVILAQVVVLWDRHAGAIYWNFTDLTDLAGGDVDGDGGAEALPSTLTEKDFVALVQGGRFPTPRVAPNGDGPVLEEILKQRARTEAKRAELGLDLDHEIMELVMGMLVKQFTGTLTYAFWVWERQAAVKAIQAQRITGDKDSLALARFTLAQRQYRGVSHLYSGLLEKVMDAGKPGETVGRGELERLVSALDRWMKGGNKAPDVRELVESFAPFMDEKHRQTLERVLRAIGTDFGTVRETAGGRLIAAGSGVDGQANALKGILAHLAKNNYQPERILEALRNDVFGISPIQLKTKAQSEEEEETNRLLTTAGPVTYHPQVEVKGMLKVLAGLRYLDKPLFVNTRLSSEDGFIAIKTVLAAHWAGTDRNGNVYCFPVSFRLPKITQEGEWGYGSFRHCTLEFPGREPVFFRPIFRIEVNESISQVGLIQYLGEQLAQVMNRLVHRRLAWRTEAKRQEICAFLSSRIGYDLGERVVDELPASSPAFAYVHQHKVTLSIPEFAEKDTLRDWEYRRKLLTWVMAQQDENGFLYGVGYTAKDAGKIGTEAAILAVEGFPVYALEWDPMMRYVQANPKRWAEYQYTDPQPLHVAQPFPVTAKGYDRPQVLTENKGETTLLCALLSVVGVNVEVDAEGHVLNHDATAFTEAGSEKLALAYEERFFKERELAEAWIETQLQREEDLTREQTEILEKTVEFMPGVQGTSYIVRLHRKTLDFGKAKSLAPFKGVQSTVPIRFFVYRDGEEVEIDCLLPRHTAIKKQALNALLLGLAAKAEITELDPNATLDELLPLIQGKLRDKKLNAQGLETVFYTDEEGNTQKLGTCVVIPLPWYRPRQTEESTASIKDDISVDLASQILCGRPINMETESWNQAATHAADLYRVWRDANHRLQSWGTSQSEELLEDLAYLDRLAPRP